MRVALGILAATLLALVAPACARAEERPEWLKRIAADLGSSYSWGTYSAPDQADDKQGGMGLHLYAGYHVAAGLELGIGGTFRFPQIAVPDSANDASFSFHSFDLRAGYLWGDRLEPFISYAPFAQLSQSSKTRMGVATITTDHTYLGHSVGAGMKLYFTDRQANAAQVGVTLAYLRESYSSAQVSSNLENETSHPTPPFTPTASTQPEAQSITGNTYTVGVFLGY